MLFYAKVLSSGPDIMRVFWCLWDVDIRIALYSPSHYLSTLIILKTLQKCKNLQVITTNYFLFSTIMVVYDYCGVLGTQKLSPHEDGKKTQNRNRKTSKKFQSHQYGQKSFLAYWVQICSACISDLSAVPWWGLPTFAPNFLTTKKFHPASDFMLKILNCRCKFSAMCIATEHFLCNVM